VRRSRVATVRPRGDDACVLARPAARTFALTWLAYASYYLGRKGFSVTKVALASQLHLSTATLAAIDTAFLAAYALGQVPAGLAADRLGARKLVGFGMLASAAACASFGFASSAHALLLCFACNGLAQATGWPGTSKAMADWTAPAERGRVMGVWSTCYQVGGMAATAVATWLLSHHGLRAVFYVPAIWMALTGLLVLLLLPAAPQVDVLPLTAADARRVSTPILARLREVHPSVYSYGASYFCIKLIRYSLLFWLPFYLYAAGGFDQARSGYLSLAFEAGGVLGSIGLGYLSDRSARSRSGMSMVSLLLLALVLLGYARSAGGGAVFHGCAMALVGLLLFGPDSVLSGAAAQDAGGVRGAATAAGIVNAIGSLGGLCQGALTLGVEQRFGWNALFYAFFGLALLSALCLVPTLVPGRSQLASRPGPRGSTP
jgi:sugar phosphate permease